MKDGGLIWPSFFIIVFVLIIVLSQKIFRDDRFTFGLSFHMTAGSTPFYPSFFNAFGVVTYERGKNVIRRFLTTELTIVIIKIYCHGSSIDYV